MLILLFAERVYPKGESFEDILWKQKDVYSQIPIPSWVEMSGYFPDDTAEEVHKYLLKEIEENKGAYQYYTDFPYAICSSYLGREGRGYLSDYLFDMNPRTCWAEGERGPGIGEWVAFYVAPLAGGEKIKGFKILNGYTKNLKIWKANNRVKRLRIEFWEPDYYHLIAYWKYKLLDTPKWQVLPAKLPLDGTGLVRFIIEDVYKGHKYNDTCISEIRFVFYEKNLKGVKARLIEYKKLRDW